MRTPQQQSFLDAFYEVDREIQEEILIDFGKREAAAIALISQLTGIGGDMVVDLIEVAAQRPEMN